MNRIHRIIWSDARQAYVVAHEHAASRGKPSSSTKRAASALAAFLISQGGYAAPLPNQLPTGGQVVAGQAAIAQSGAAMTVNQASNRAAINWNTFSIGSNAQVKFVQPSASAVALNRVTGSDPSSIYGTLSANGQVFLVNPNGVLFARGAQVNVSGIVASTMGITDADFMARNNLFTRNGATGSVVNDGRINANYAALLGPQVINDGVIVAHEAALAAGDAVTLGITGNDLVDVQVPKASVNTLVNNGGAIQADAGTVVMSAQSASQLLGQVVNSGDIEANGIASGGGTVKLLASGTIDDSGSISANAGASGKGGAINLIADLSNPQSRTTVSGSISSTGKSGGGFIETSGSHLAVSNTANIDTSSRNGLTGSWLLDPNDFTVASTATGTVTGGSPSGDISGATLGTALNTANVTILSSQGSSAGSGNINVNDNVSWSAGTTLTLTASNNVNVNSSISATGTTAGIALNPNTANGAETASGTGTFNMGNSGSISLPNVSSTSTAAFKLNGVSYSVINSLGSQTSSGDGTLQGMNGNLAGNYVLGSNIDASATSTWNGNAGFTPIGGTSGTAYTVSTPFTGIFDGLGHTISNLTIKVAASSPPVGLFGGLANTAGSGIIRNAGLVGGSVTASSTNFVGALVGSAGPGSSVIHSYATGSVTGAWYAGGLVGQNLGTISKSAATGSVTGTGYSGGLVGVNSGTGAGIGTITNSYATGNVTVGAGVEAGGLVGHNFGGAINNSYATGSATAGRLAGGLVGMNDSVTFPAPITGTISNSYSTGKVTATTTAGGLAGGNYGSITNSFWDNQKSGQSASMGSGTATGATGLTTASMQQAAPNSFTTAGWSTSTWTFAANSYPNLATAAVPYVAPSIDYITVALANTTQTYGATSGPAFGAYSLISSTLLSGDTLSFNWGSAWSSTLAVSGSPYAYSTANLVTPVITSISGHTASNYSVAWATPANGNGQLTVNPRPVTLTGSKVYDGKAITSGAALSVSNTVNSDTVTVSNSGTTFIASKNVGTEALINFVGLSLSNPNYTLTGASGSVNVSPLALTGASIASVSTPYGTAASAGAVSFGNVVTGDNVTAAVSINSPSYSTSGKLKAGSYTQSASSTLSGTDAGNYTFSGFTTTTANYTVSKLALTVSAQGSNKVYDGNTTGSVTLSTAGVLPGDVVSVSASSAAFADRNVGNGKAVSVSGITASGADSSNYSLNASATASASITQLSSVDWVGGATGNWSSASSWAPSSNHAATGAIPDAQNAANVNIPAGSSVTFDSRVAATTLTSLNAGQTTSTSGSLTVSASGLSVTGSTTLATFAMAGGAWSQIASTLPAFSVTNFNYTGGTFVRALGGDGSAANPYQLADIYGVQGMAGKPSASYKLANDIDASGTTNWNSGAGFVPVGNFMAKFTGSFDGLNHTISNLAINSPSTDFVGLFGYGSGTSSIGNVGLVGGSITGKNNVGGLAGYQNGGTISNSYATGSVSGSGAVGGLVGVAASGTISNSYATGSVTAGVNGIGVGGLVGVAASGTISNSYATGSVSGSRSVGGLVGSSTGTISNSYATGIVSGSNNVGGLAGSSANNFINSYWDTTTSGQTTSAGGATGLTTAQLAAALPAGFNGTVWGNGDNRTTPYLLSNAGFSTVSGHVILGTDTSATPAYRDVILNVTQLQNINNNLSGNDVLGQNIDASATSGWNNGAGFVPVGNRTTNFTGSFDGLSHTISNLAINRPTTDNVGLFGYTYGNISNVGLVGGSIKGRNNVGGLVGGATGAISNSYATGIVSGGSTVGGLAGYLYGGSSISNSYATGSVSGIKNIGGLVGGAASAISNSYATGSVSGSGYNVGGLVGDTFGSSISNSYATGNVSGSSSKVGGLVGWAQGTVGNSYATGSVSGNDIVGGLVGYGSGSISSSYATGNVAAINSAGGLVASAKGPISNSYATGIVTAGTSAGGLVASSTGTISNSYATGSVTAGTYAGGLIASASGTISNSYATGSAIAGTSAGGLVASASGTISNSYATGNAKAGSYAGGLVASASGKISNSYWDTTASGMTVGVGNGSATGATGLSTSAMQKQASFTGLDFANTWVMYDNHTSPLLRAFMTPLKVTASAATMNSSGTAYTAGLVNAVYSVAGAATSGHLYNLGTPYGGNAANVGSYASDLYSDQQGYIIDQSGVGKLVVTNGSAAAQTQSATIIASSSGSNSQCAVFSCTLGLITASVPGGSSLTSPPLNIADNIYTDTGNSTVVVSSGSNLISDNPTGNSTIPGGDGSSTFITLHSKTNNTIPASSGSSTVVGGSGGVNLISDNPAGNSTIPGGNGNSTQVAPHGTGGLITLPASALPE